MSDKKLTTPRNSSQKGLTLTLSGLALFFTFIAIQSYLKDGFTIRIFTATCLVVIAITKVLMALLSSSLSESDIKKISSKVAKDKEITDAYKNNYHVRATRLIRKKYGLSITDTKQVSDYVFKSSTLRR